MKKPYVDFKTVMRARESSARYDKVNRFGFLGAYQFGVERLADFRLTWKTPDGRFDWCFPYSKDQFLKNPTLQDALFDLHVVNLALRITSQIPEAQAFDLSGLVAIAHLLGLGGVRNHVKGQYGRDALGTSSEDYYKLFQGYDIPLKLG